jgi:hypothetical protein
MLALDADGTLVDPQGRLRPAVREAVAKARERGLIVVVCTGRRYRTALPLLEELELEGPVVLHNGVLVKDARTGDTLAGRFLPNELYAPAIEMMRGVAPPLVYVDQYFEGTDVYTEPRGRCHEFQAEYLASNLDAVREVVSLDEAPSPAIVMISLMADGKSLLSLKRDIEPQLGPTAQTHFIMNKNYRGHILEIARSGVGKWSALLALAQAEGVRPEQIAAIGDDTNDCEMVASAGIGIAMGNAVDEVKAAAHWVTESNDRDGVASAIERLLAQFCSPDAPS